MNICVYDDSNDARREGPAAEASATHGCPRPGESTDLNRSI